MVTLRRMTNRRLIVTLAVTALGVSGSTWAVAAGGGDDARQRSATAASAKIAGATSGGPCKVGYDTQTATNIPPDDSTSDNPPAGSVTFTKSCGGAVIGNFSSEVSMPTASDFLHLDMRATCIGTGGFAAPRCTLGQQVFASPGHSFFQNGQTPVHVGSAQMVWTGLARGRWTFEVLPGGNNSANLQFRSFVVTAYPGG
jgi:hypothetical protein